MNEFLLSVAQQLDKNAIVGRTSTFLPKCNIYIYLYLYPTPYIEIVGGYPGRWSKCMEIGDICDPTFDAEDFILKVKKTIKHGWLGIWTNTT